jgi:peptidoglycan lytic transglycosylase
MSDDKIAMTGIPFIPASRESVTIDCWFLCARYCIVMLSVAMLSACGTTAKREPGERVPQVSKAPSVPPRGGGYYLDDGPGNNPPANLDSVPDAVPRAEPIHRGSSRPYAVMGRNYMPMTAVGSYKARGLASWYGRRYHGRPTSSGEIYDMYGMTAAHTTLPIPSYARVTNLANGKAVVVRINDRGPFLYDRLIDLSYTAAYKLGVLAGGNVLVEVESIVPGSSPPMVATAAPATTRPVTGSPRETTSAAANREPEPVATPLPAGEPQAPASVAQAPEIPLAGDAGGIYLQLAAFGSRENAESYLARLKIQIDWLTQALHVFSKDGLFRVHAGPYRNHAEARQVADRISQSVGLRPMVLTR